MAVPGWAGDSAAVLWNQGWRFFREPPPPPAPVFQVAAGDLLGQGEFADGAAAQSAAFASRSVRYVILEALSSQHAGEPFTSLAELDLLDAQGRPLPRDGWKAVFADSEETHDENGRAANILDGKPNTIWHTAYSNGAAKLPHAVVVDLGTAQAVSGLRCLPRQSNTPGMIKGWRLYGTQTPPVPMDPARGGSAVPAAIPEAAPGFADAAWEAVSLPHTVRIEPPLEAGRHFQGLCWYRKHFDTDPAWAGKKVQLRFDGAMQVAEVWLNGQSLAIHKGGYLPFIVDLTAGLKPEGGNVLAVRLDNRDTPDVPPGKPLGSMDFTYFGGLYRNVSLRVVDPLHIPDVFEADQVAGGGLFVRTEKLEAGTATVSVQADVRNDGAKDEEAMLVGTVVAPDGTVVARMQEAFAAKAGGTHRFSVPVAVPEARLWTPDQPALYTLKAELRRDGQVLQLATTRFGIRTLAYDDKLGFVLNGQPLRLRGANRHQDFPWLGNALADNVQYRDLKRLKEAGFNFLRLAHYPQAESVMDACDELGLMVSVCTPGWQWWNQDPSFADRARQNIREMVRWHRNHPCAIMWETSLNETYGKDAFYAECCRIAREEYPGGQLFTCGDSYASRDVSHYDIPYCGWPGNGYNRPAAPGFEGRKRSFIREYGDNDSGINTRISIGGGAERSEWNQLSQAWAHQWTHNVNNRWDWHVGDAIWVGVDHFRGCGGSAPISTCGVLDWQRQPKFSYYFYQSQRRPELPSLFVASYWTPRPSPAKVVVYSNCDEVELLLNGQSLGRQKPDAGEDSRLGDPKPEEAMLTNYMKTGKSVQDFEKMIEARKKQGNRKPIYTGGDCRHLDHAPFTFPLVPFAAGELKAVGYLQGKKVCEAVRRTPGAPAALRLVPETLGRELAADGADAIFVRAQVVDAQGEVVPDANLPVQFAVAGPARIVSPAEARSESDGVATMLLQAGTAPGEIAITAQAPGLAPARTTLQSR